MKVKSLLLTLAAASALALGVGRVQAEELHSPCPQLIYLAPDGYAVGTSYTWQDEWGNWFAIYIVSEDVWDGYSQSYVHRMGDTYQLTCSGN